MITRTMITVALFSLISEDKFTSKRDEDSPITTYYQVPDHQRFPDWPLYKKQRLVDSVLKNFPIHAIIGVEKKKIQDNRIIEWCDIEDGQTRLTYLQEFMMNKYPCESGSDCIGNGCRFSELPILLQQRFMNYQISIEMFRGDNITSDDIAEIFTRLNGGTPLGDNDKYHSRIETPVLIYLEELKNHPELRKDFTKFIGPIGTGKKRPLLAHIVGAILAIGTRHGNIGGQACINTSYELNYKYLRNPFTHEQKNDIFNFFKAYFEMLHQKNDNIDAKPKRRLYCKLTGILGLSVCSWVRFGRIQEEIAWYVGKKIENTKYIPETFSQLNKGDIQNCQGSSIWRRLEKIMEQCVNEYNGSSTNATSGNKLQFIFSSDDESDDDISN